MKRIGFLTAATVCAVSLTSACSKSGTLTPTGTAPADGSTLKATAPAPVSPVNGQKPSVSLELTVTNSTMEFGSGVTPLYRFEIYSGSTRVYESPLVPAGNGTTTHAPNVQLNPDQPYQWQARVEAQGAVGPWTTPRASFTGFVSGGYIKANEIYDPLTNGTSVGRVHGPVVFIPGVGARFDSDEAYIEYPLAQTVTAGEFSALVSNLKIISATEDPKYRVLTMREGTSAINDNEYRMSVDKRGNGAVAYRFITGNANAGSYIESGPADRQVLNWDRNTWYFWQVRWGGSVFGFTIREDTPTGKLFYDLSRGYQGLYQPLPHMVYLGSPFTPGDRGEPSTVEDMIVKQVWVSASPRPAFASQ